MIHHGGFSVQEVHDADHIDSTLDVDFTDAPGAHPGSHGGGVLISFDPSLLSIAGFTASGAASVVDELPSVPPVDCTGAMVLCFVEAPDTGSIGTFSFLVNPDLEPTPGEPIEIAIGIADVDDFFGTFANRIPTNQAFVPDFIGTSVFAVPVPATAWLIASGLAVFGSFARRRH